MEARQILIALIVVTANSSVTLAQGTYIATRNAASRAIGPQAIHQVRSDNFIVSAATPALANEVIQTAESLRQELAMHWLGHELPKWSQPCPIMVQTARDAGGKTQFTFDRGSVGQWQMEVQGTPERILDSVLPHEITHTVLATHFAPLGRPVPRWADEGASTTVEHQDERSKHDGMLIQFLTTGHGIPFDLMFKMEEYPRDIMPLYAQGYSVASFLIAQGGPRRFVEYLESGMRTNDWVRATEQFYAYPKIGSLKVAWNKWVADGGGEVVAHTADALGLSSRSIAPAGGLPSEIGAVRLASAAGSPRPAGPTKLAAAPTQNWSSNNRSLSADPPSISSSQVNPNRPQDDTGWYKRQLSQNQSANPAATRLANDDVAIPGAVAEGDRVPIPNRPDVLSANSATVSGPSQPPQIDLSRINQQHSVGHPQPMQTIGGQVRNWSSGPATTLYR